MAHQAKAGNDLVLSGKFGDVAYLDTSRDLGVVLEIFRSTPPAAD